MPTLAIFVLKFFMKLYIKVNAYKVIIKSIWYMESESSKQTPLHYCGIGSYFLRLVCHKLNMPGSKVFLSHSYNIEDRWQGVKIFFKCKW